MSIVWQDPPPSLRSSKWRQDVVAELKKKPGQWALVQSKVKHSSFVASWKKLGCEATMRTVGESLYDVYARWPEPSEGAQGE